VALAASVLNESSSIAKDALSIFSSSAFFLRSMIPDAYWRFSSATCSGGIPVRSIRLFDPRLITSALGVPGAVDFSTSWAIVSLTYPYKGALWWLRMLRRRASEERQGIFAMRIFERVLLPPGTVGDVLGALHLVEA
jgi:hypothetical protein